jgi:hypothetical protein
MAGRLNPETCGRLLAFLNSPECGVYLRSAFDWYHSVSEVMKQLDDLKSENVALRCEYRDLTTKLRSLYERVRDYIDTVNCRPVFNKRAVSAELRDSDENARFDIENVDRFPHIIDYLNQLYIWLRRIKKQLKDVDKRLKIVQRETEKAAFRVQVVKDKAGTKKRITLGALGVAGTLATASGGALLLAGGVAFGVAFGVALIPAGGAAALLSYYSSSSFKSVEDESKKISIDIDEINKAAHKLAGIEGVVERERKANAIAQEIEFVHAPRPLLVTLKKSLATLSDLIESGGNFEQERNQARGIFQDAYRPHGQY